MVDKEMHSSKIGKILENYTQQCSERQEDQRDLKNKTNSEQLLALKLFGVKKNRMLE